MSWKEPRGLTLPGKLGFKALLCLGSAWYSTQASFPLLTETSGKLILAPPVAKALQHGQSSVSLES